MSLRTRILLTLLAITTLLVAPAAYGLLALRELEAIVRELRTRDAVGSLALGRLQAALEAVENDQLIYLAFAQGESTDRGAVKARVDAGVRRVDTELASLAQAGYGPATASARRQWAALRQAIEQEQSLVDRGAVEEADRHRDERVDPALAAMDATLVPIGTAINRSGSRDVQRAQEVADNAGATTLLALAAALALSVGIGMLLARALLRPIGELRRGMAVVAEGDFEPDLRIPEERTDELGDLARSFRSMTNQLAELDRLKAEFVSIASHEIKTPLSVIRGYVSLLIDGIYGEINERQTKTLTAVSDQTDRLTRLVQRLLDVTRFEAGGGRLELRQIDTRAFLLDLTTGFEVLAFQNDIDFQVRTSDDLPKAITGDPDRLNEVLGNLLSNAFKFTPKGGSIKLAARRRDGGIEVMVADSGVGIPPDKLPKIFEKFFQVENEAQPRSVGSGLGLAIAREIVEAHGGTIGAESQLGSGTRFSVFLPEHPPVSHGT